MALKGFIQISFILLLIPSEQIKVDQPQEIKKTENNNSEITFQRKLEESENYIVLHYREGNDIQYTSGFYNRYREDIDHIIIENSTFGNYESLTIKGGSMIEIHFSKPIDSLEYFFSSDKDELVVNIICVDLTHFNSSKITSLDHTFYGCSSLTSIDFTNFKTPLLTNMKYAFGHCTSFISIDLSNLDTSSVTNMGRMFFGCHSLKSINVSKLNTSSVKDMDSLFYECISLESIDLSSFNTSSLKYMSGLFDGCTALKSFDISNFDTSSVIYMDNLFYACASLKEINLSNFKTSSVEYMNDMFFECISLESIDISNFNTSSVNSMRSMFSECQTLKSLDLSNLDTSLVIDMSNMFSNCESLKYLDISGFVISNDAIIDNMFDGLNNIQCINLNDIIASSEFFEYIEKSQGINNNSSLIVCRDSYKVQNTASYCCEYNNQTDSYERKSNYIIVHYNKDTNYSNGFNNSFRQDISFIVLKNEKLTSKDELNIKSDTNLEIHFYTPINNMEKFFSQTEDNNMLNVDSIDFSNFDSLSITNMASLFYGCSSLKSINIANLNTSSVVDMNSMFYNCRSLNFTELPSFNTSKVTNMAYMFRRCESLVFLNLTNFNTKNVVNMSSTFRQCQNIVTIDISNFDTRKVTTMSHIFSNCGKLKNLYYLSNLNSPSVTDRVGMFDGCISLFTPDNPNYQSENPYSRIILLGFDQLNINISKINFNAYFISLDAFVFPETINCTANIRYNSLLRVLDDNENVICQNQNLNDENKVKYSCLIEAKNENINNIAINNDINFGSKNVTLGITSLASNYITNLQNLPKNFDNLYERKTNILQNSYINQEEKLFNITGIMNGDPVFSLNEDLIIISSKISDNTSKEINCKVVDTTTENYTLNCRLDDTEEYDLNNSFSFNDNASLLINFDDSPSNIKYNETNTKPKYKKFIYQKSSGLNSGGIVAIIIVPIVVVGILATTYFLLRKNNIKNKGNNDSNTTKLNIQSYNSNTTKVNIQS